MDGVTELLLVMTGEVSSHLLQRFYASRQRMLQDLQAWIDSGFDLCLIVEEVAGTAVAVRSLVGLRRG